MNNFQNAGSLRKSPTARKGCPVLLGPLAASASLGSREVPHSCLQRKGTCLQQIYSTHPSFPDTNFHENQTQDREQGRDPPPAWQICSLVSLGPLACFGPLRAGR